MSIILLLFLLESLPIAEALVKKEASLFKKLFLIFSQKFVCFEHNNYFIYYLKPLESEVGLFSKD